MILVIIVIVYLLCIPYVHACMHGYYNTFVLFDVRGQSAKMTKMMLLEVIGIDVYVRA